MFCRGQAQTGEVQISRSVAREWRRTSAEITLMICRDTGRSAVKPSRGIAQHPSRPYPHLRSFHEVWKMTIRTRSGRPGWRSPYVVKHDGRTRGALALTANFPGSRDPYFDGPETWVALSRTRLIKWGLTKSGGGSLTADRQWRRWPNNSGQSADNCSGWKILVAFLKPAILTSNRVQ